MGYLPNYAWDVFISYAHDDNEASGWVSEFRRRLVRLIESGLDTVSVFFDERDLRSYNTIESILTEVERSALFVVIGSPNWVRPGRWCQQELTAFLGHRADTSRIFIAEYEPPHGANGYPAALPNNARVKFWSDENRHQVPTPLSQSDQEFEHALRKLARDIRERLESLRSAGTGEDKAAGRHAVFLAYPTEDVLEEHEALSDYLRGQGIDILPRGPMPPHPDGLRKLLDADLKRAAVFVQMLGRRKARPVEAGEASPTFVQAETAEAMGVPAFTWRPDDVDPHRNPDEDYQRLLRTAQNATPTELAQTILAKLEALAKDEEKPAPAATAGCDLRLVVSADPEDTEAARLLLDQCRDRSHCYAIADVFDNDDLEDSEWVDATAVAFVQRDVPPRTIMARYRVFNRVRTSSGVAGKLRGQALVFFPPPENKAKGLIVAPGLKEIDLCETASLDPFVSWLDSLPPADPDDR